MMKKTRMILQNYYSIDQSSRQKIFLLLLMMISPFEKDSPSSMKKTRMILQNYYSMDQSPRQKIILLLLMMMTMVEIINDLSLELSPSEKVSPSSMEKTRMILQYYYSIELQPISSVHKTPSVFPLISSATFSHPMTVLTFCMHSA